MMNTFSSLLISSSIAVLIASRKGTYNQVANPSLMINLTK